MALTSQRNIIQDASLDDAVIMVMGMTGAGKSTFLSSILGHDDMIGHDLSSYTQGVEIYSHKIKGRMVHFVDTPGFNDTWRSDLEILKHVAFILSQIYRRRMNLCGIIYLHRISDNRVTGSAMKNFALLRNMCGAGAASRVMLVTSMWEADNADETKHREAELRESALISNWDFWGGMCQHGSQTRRWKLGDSSAMSIVEELMQTNLGGNVAVLQIQRELVDQKKPLHKTAAGAQLRDEHSAVEKRLLEDLEDARAGSEIMELDDVTYSTSALGKEVSELRQSQREMQISLSKLIAEKERVYATALEKMRREQENLAEQLQESQQKQERLGMDMMSNEELLRDERGRWEYRRQELRRQERLGRRSARSLERERAQMEEEEAIFDEEQRENEKEKVAVSETTERLRRRDVIKRNILPFLGVLAGVGMGIAGAVTGALPLIPAGIGLAMENGSQINLSRKAGVYEGGSGAASSVSLMSSTSEALEGSK